VLKTQTYFTIVYYILLSFYYKRLEIKCNLSYVFETFMGILFKTAKKFIDCLSLMLTFIVVNANVQRWNVRLRHGDNP